MTYTDIPSDVALAAAAFLDALEAHGIRVSTVEVSPTHSFHPNIGLHTEAAVEGTVHAFHHASRDGNVGKWRMVLHGVPTADAREEFAARVVANQRATS